MLEVIPYVRALLYQSHSEVGNAKQVRSFLIDMYVVTAARFEL
jgi:hypothetical protein